MMHPLSNFMGEDNFETRCPCLEYSNNGQDNKCEVCQHLAVFHATKKVTPVWLMYICLSNVPYVYVYNVMFKEEKKIGDMSVQQLRVNTYLVKKKIHKLITSTTTKRYYQN